MYAYSGSLCWSVTRNENKVIGGRRKMGMSKYRKRSWKGNVKWNGE